MEFVIQIPNILLHKISIADHFSHEFLEFVDLSRVLDIVDHDCGFEIRSTLCNSFYLDSLLAFVWNGVYFQGQDVVAFLNDVFHIILI